MCARLHARAEAPKPLVGPPTFAPRPNTWVAGVRYGVGAADDVAVAAADGVKLGDTGAGGAATAADRPAFDPVPGVDAVPAAGLATDAEPGPTTPILT